MLKNLKLHGTGNGHAQEVDNTYNIRGWLRRINDPENPKRDRLFNMELTYETHHENALKRYNGNISSAFWLQKGDDATKGYNFEYDPLNRLTAAHYGEGLGLREKTGWFSTSYSYDINGNLQNLVRASKAVVIDDLAYQYVTGGQSNRLRSITDRSHNPDGYHASPTNDRYGYDMKGNMTHHPSKNARITYNHLNLPTRAQFGPNTADHVQYTYTATGRKVQKKASRDKGEIAITDYSGIFICQDNRVNVTFCHCHKK